MSIVLVVLTAAGSSGSFASLNTKVGFRDDKDA